MHFRTLFCEKELMVNLVSAVQDSPWRAQMKENMHVHNRACVLKTVNSLNVSNLLELYSKEYSSLSAIYQ